MRIVAVDAEARDQGILPGMALADARARLPDLQAVPQDADADAALLNALAEGCERYTPSVMIDLPDGLILDITGCAHLWAGEDALIGDLQARLDRKGLTVRLTVAETPDRARAFARHSAFPGLATGDLPVAALDPAPDQERALRRAGLHSLGDLACRPRTLIAARFGTALVTRLARVLGEEDARITPRRTIPAISLLRRFAEPVAQSDFVLEAIAALVSEACTALRERGEGGRRFVARLFRSDGAVHRLAIETGRPVREAAPVLRLFGERIDTLADPLDPGFGYDAVRIDVPHTEKLAAAQEGLDRDETPHVATADLLDRLSVRLGTRRVQRFAAGNSHIPELAGFTLAASAPALPFPWPRPESGEPPLRPLLLFDPPQPVEVMAEVPDGPPRRFRWRRTFHDIVAHEGPERIAAEWWKRKDAKGLTRDYYRVEDTEGRRFWIFRHGLYGAEKAMPGWYLHGRFA